MVSQAILLLIVLRGLRRCQDRDQLFLSQIVGDVGRSHYVFAAIHNHQAEHQAIVIKTTGDLGGISYLFLFYSAISYSFIFPSIVERCGLVVAKQGDRWQVELATGSKVAIDSFVHGCMLDLGACTTSVDLHVLSLGSYGVVLGMD